MMGALALAIALLVGRAPRLPVRPAGPTAEDIGELATLVAMCLDAGMTPAAAIGWTQPFVHSQLAAEAATLARRARLDGLATGLREARGSAAGLFSSLARAVETGAAVRPVLDAFRERLEADSRAEAEARLQRLPIKLVFPLALLMLPGLVLMVSGPALIEVFGRFS